MAPTRENLPFGRASIASGYTPAAVSGPCRPQPLKGRKERMPREKKTEIITLRVTPRTKAVIQARAKSVNKTVTDYLCLCGLGKEIVQVEGLDKVLPS
jgi:hypothetical protein